MSVHSLALSCITNFGVFHFTCSICCVHLPTVYIVSLLPHHIPESGIWYTLLITLQELQQDQL